MRIINLNGLLKAYFFNDKQIVITNMKTWNHRVVFTNIKYISLKD